MGRLFLILFVVLSSLPVLAQTSDHVADVRRAQRSAYVISQATNGCPVVGTDLFGWPGSKIVKCVYDAGPPDARMTGVAYLLTVPAEAIALWIETSCAGQMPGAAGCFKTVLTCGRLNSGMMFAVSGNVLEDMDDKPWKNYFFRNGMTVSIGGQLNGTTDSIPVERQEELAMMPDSAITSIPSGLTRYWRTLPKQFAALFPNENAPTALSSREARQKWLDMARAEFLSALGGPTNRLLDAWMAAHPQTLQQGRCPKDSDP